MDNCNPTPPASSKPSYDPGWNDPPKLAYNSLKTTPNRPRNFLNKRVAFPMSNTPPVTNPAQPVNMPPLPTLKSTTLPTSNTSISKNEEMEVDSESALIEVKNILLTFLDESTELGQKSNDIKRRLGVMEEMWSSGKLNKSVHSQMRQLAYAIKDNKPTKADEIHRALMVDHVSAVGSWMPGVKQLIHHCIARSELIALDNE